MQGAGPCRSLAGREKGLGPKDLRGLSNPGVSVGKVDTQQAKLLKVVKT